MEQEFIQNDEIMQDQLMHYGILGMRWGHRKGGVSTTSSKKSKNKDANRRMSNAELKSRINRLRLEKEYANLTKETKPSRISKAKVDNAVKTLGTVAAVTGSAMTIYKNVNQVMAMVNKAK